MAKNPKTINEEIKNWKWYSYLESRPTTISAITIPNKPVINVQKLDLFCIALSNSYRNSIQVKSSLMQIKAAFDFQCYICSCRINRTDIFIQANRTS